MHILTGYLIPFIFVLGLLIFIHELGHFILAKLVGIRVERFSMGFPPRLFGKKIGDTDYCISALPFGGYVKMSGMIDESMEKEAIKGEPYEFMSKPIWARVLVIAAGPAMNILLAIFIFAASFFFKGIMEIDSTFVGSVQANLPAQQAGIAAGDKIIRIGEQSVQKWEDLVQIIHNNADQPIQVTWQRNDSTFSALITPQKDPNHNIGLIGIAPKIVNRELGLLASVGMSFTRAWDLTRLVGTSLGMIFSGKVSIKEGLAGPVGIAKMAGEASKEGFLTLIMFAAFLSLNLGLLNILPIPVLDGGHLVFLGIEAIIRRPPSVKVRLITQQVGMAILLALMVYVIINDVTKFF